MQDELSSSVSSRPVERPVDTILIAPSFFGYAAAMCAELQKRGRSVLWFEDRPSTDVRSKALIRLSPNLLAARALAYFDGITARVASMPIRDVLVVKGEAMSGESVKRMRQAFPQARFTLYFWDSYRNMPGDSRRKVDLFDRVLSFDIKDIEADPRLVYRPLFFRDEYAKLGPVEQDIDLLFIGTLHSDRHAVLDRIARALPAGTVFKRILFSRSKAIHHVENIMLPSRWKRNDMTTIFTPLTAEETAKLAQRSRILVDIERSIQSGYTMRTLEALGVQRKLITTNPEVARADFFDPANILTIDRYAPSIPASFLSEPYHAVPEEIRRRYGIAGWMDDVLQSPSPSTTSASVDVHRPGGQADDVHADGSQTRGAAVATRD